MPPGLDPDRRYLFGTYRFVDMARKVVGVGSVGTRAWVFLLVGRDGQDPLVLQAKEAQASVLEPYLGESEFENHGERVVRGQRMDQAAPDVFLSWQRSEDLDGREHDFYIRQLWDWKASIDLSTMKYDGLHAYSRACGWSLARAHARSGDRLAIAAYLGGGAKFDTAIARFSARLRRPERTSTISAWPTRSPPARFPRSAVSEHDPASGDSSPPPPPSSSRSAALRRSAETARAAAERQVERAKERRAVREALESLASEQRTGATLLAGGLAYRFFLWLVPFGLVAAAIVSFWVRDSQRSLTDAAKSFGLGGVAARSATSAVEEGSNARWFLLIAGLALMLWAGISAVRALRVAARLAWGVQSERLRRPLRASAAFTRRSASSVSRRAWGHRGSAITRLRGES